ncbi:MAG: hypothetical protein IH859_00275 [Chloroflexi bacterium]|nr:hypothetical protein [Chloroflexota bacterium]
MECLTLHTRKHVFTHRFLLWISAPLMLVLASCGSDVPFTPSATPTPTYTATITPAATSSYTPTLSLTSTPTITPTPTLTLTPSITPTPTFDFPDALARVQAFCRYGPGTAYLHSYGLAASEHVEIHNRNQWGDWLWVKPDNLDRRCWVSASVLDITGDIFSVVVYESALPKTTFVGPPTGVYTVREDNLVTVYWNETVPNKLADKRGYLLEVWVCQNGSFFWMAVQTDKIFYKFRDGPGCAGTSSGLLYTAEKHGYSAAVILVWP